MTLKTRNTLQVHILHLLEKDFDIKLFQDLSILWNSNLNLKQVVKLAYLIGGLSHEKNIL